MTGQELHEHVQQLAEDMDVQVWVCLTCPGDYGEARYTHSTGDRMVLLTEPPDESRMYLVALHELGHHADPSSWSRGRQLDREAWAWRWAIEHSRVDLTKAEWGRILQSLLSYIRDRRYKRTPDFDSLLDEAVGRAV